jgi:hypothetical protein
MSRDFLAAIDAAVELALPVGWPRVPCERLPACGSTRARHAFRRPAMEGPGAYLAVVAAPDFAGRSVGSEGELAALVELILGRGASVLLLYEAGEDPDDWIHDFVSCPHPRLLTLACHGTVYEVEPTWAGREPLLHAIRDLWSGGLFYDGPCEGAQTTGVEIMRDSCWRCRADLRTVTGIVLPDREVEDWSAPDWTYFQQLVELAAIPDTLIPTLSAAVDGWRAAGEVRLTPIRWRYSKTVQDSYWAAECPACGAFRGAFPVMEERMRYLHDLASRQRGDLSYHPLTLDVTRQLLRDLAQGAEVNPHCRPYSWRRPGTPDLPGSAFGSLIGAVHLLADPDDRAAGRVLHVTGAGTPTPSSAPGFFKRLGQIFASFGVVSR